MQIAKLVLHQLFRMLRQPRHGADKFVDIEMRPRAETKKLPQLEELLGIC